MKPVDWLTQTENERRSFQCTHWRLVKKKTILAKSRRLVLQNTKIQNTKFYNAPGLQSDYSLRSKRFASIIAGIRWVFEFENSALASQASLIRNCVLARECVWEATGRVSHVSSTYTRINSCMITKREIPEQTHELPY